MPPRDRPAQPINRHLWLVEPLEDDPTLIVKPMFGARAVYFRGRMVLVLSDKAEPWRGVLVPTERVHQPALISDRPALAPHPVLPKWLYLPEAAPTFEADAQWLVERIRRGDERVGIIPPQKRARRKATRPGQGSS